MKNLLHRILDGCQITLGDNLFSNPESYVGWHQLALEGKWEGHWMGPFSLDAPMLKQIVDHFEGAKIDTVVDYEHQSVYGDKAPAAGWIKSLQVRKEDGASTLWGQVEWTNAAGNHIKEKEYRYLSPTIIFNTRDRKSGKLTGASLHSVALTNKPFLHELPEVRLNSIRAAFLQSYPEEESMNSEQMKQLLSALGLPEDAQADDIIAKCNEFGNGIEHWNAVAGHLNVSDGQAALNEIAKIKTQATVSPQLTEEITSLRTQIAELSADKTKRLAMDAVTNAQRDGKVAGIDSDNYKNALSWAMRDLESFVGYMATVPANSIVPASQVKPAPVTKDSFNTEESTYFQKYAGQLGLTEDDITAGKKAGII